MSGFAEYDGYDATGLAELVRSGDVTPAELLEEAIARAEALNPALNAIVTPLYEQARRKVAGSPEDGAPFAGVPFLLKDILHAHAGVRITSGSASLRDYVPDRDSQAVARFRRAGLVPIGMTNVPEFGLLATTESEAHGPTRNPWDLARSAGGSSGGAAAAVAAGIVPMASATDGGGSIRIPAAWCGLFGLKPSRGRLFGGPYYGEIWSGAVVDGVVTRSVRDSAAALDAITGAAPGDPYLAVVPARPFREEVEVRPRPLKIAFSTDSPIGTSVAPECRRAVEETIPLLESLGHTVTEASPKIDGHAAARCYLILCAAHVAADLRIIARKFGPHAAARIEPGTRIAQRVGESIPAAEFVQARLRWNTFARAVADFHDRFDLFLTPTTATEPPRIGESLPSGLEKRAMRLVGALPSGGVLRLTGLYERLALEQLAPVPFTQLANYTGQPAMSVPLHWNEEGQPFGVHFSAPLGDEATLIQLAAQLEEARPWAHRRPPTWGRRPILTFGS